MKSAVCLFARDEERDIAEWLAYQFAIGFDACLIYDNGSIDRTPDIVRAFGRNHDVRLVPWNDTQKFAQIGAYADCIARFGAHFDWIGCVDADEFIVPLTDIPTLLTHQADSTSAIALNWRMFGSSGLTIRPHGLLIETFVHRAPDDFGPNQQIKSIVRPAEVAAPRSPHGFTLRSGDYVGSSGRPVEWLHRGAIITPDFAGGCVNHYFTRSRAEWDRKVTRGYRDGTVRVADRGFEVYDRNEVEDHSAARFAPKVKDIMARAERVNGARNE